jgi:hypothetical protein
VVVVVAGGGGGMPDYVGWDIWKLKMMISDNYCLLSLKNKPAKTSNGERIFHSQYIIDIYSYIPIIRYSFLCSSYYSSEYFHHFLLLTTFSFIITILHFLFIAFIHLGINLLRIEVPGSSCLGTGTWLIL